MFRHVVTPALLVLGTVVGSSTVAAQISTGTIVRMVKDSSAAVVASARAASAGRRMPVRSRRRRF